MRRSGYILAVILAAAGPSLAASVQTTKPELTGFSTERLARIHEMVQRHMDAHDISGAVTLVARNGKIGRGGSRIRPAVRSVRARTHLRSAGHERYRIPSVAGTDVADRHAVPGSE